MQFQNGCNKVAIELRVVQFWSEIILVISFDFEITHMISDQIALHSVQLSLFMHNECFVVSYILNQLIIDDSSHRDDIWPFLKFKELSAGSLSICFHSNYKTL